MGCRLIRTPKGLDYLKVHIRRSLGGKQAPAKVEYQVALMLQQLHTHHCSIWCDGVWEVLSCDNTQTKLIVSDHPVTIYIKGVFPGAQGAQYPFDPAIELLGSHTLVPLSLNRICIC